MTDEPNSALQSVVYVLFGDCGSGDLFISVHATKAAAYARLELERQKVTNAGSRFEAPRWYGFRVVSEVLDSSETVKPVEVIEIRCLWERTDYGHISLLAAARGYGGRKLGSYQDAITDEDFAKWRRHHAEVHPTWRLVESVVKIPAGPVEALFTDGAEIEALSDVT